MPETEPVVVHYPGNNNNDNRNTGVDEDGVDGCCGLNSKVDKTIETSNSNNPLHNNELFVFKDKLALNDQVTEPKAAENNKSDCPSPEGKRHRWDRSVHSTAEDKITGPEEGGEYQ